MGQACSQGYQGSRFLFFMDVIYEQTHCYQFNVAAIEFIAHTQNVID